MNYKQEAQLVLDILKREKRFESIYRSIVREIGQVSTFYFYYNEREFYSGDHFRGTEDLLPYLKSILFIDDEIEKNIELIYGLYLLSISCTRHEELNNQEFSLDGIAALFKKKLNYFGCPVDQSISLFEMAEKLCFERNNLPPNKSIYQYIDGSTRIHDELVMEKKGSKEFDAYYANTLKILPEIKTTEDCLKLLNDISIDLRNHTNADFTLFNGHREHLKSGQHTNPDSFFSYVYIKDSPEVTRETEFKDIEGIMGCINEVFKSGVQRYFMCGYQSLWPGIAINENNRPQHNRVGLKSLIRCPGSVFGKPNLLDLRCASMTDSNAFNTEHLNILMLYVELYTKIVEHSRINNIMLPTINKM